jgi:hypothetical protein
MKLTPSPRLQEQPVPWARGRDMTLFNIYVNNIQGVSTVYLVLTVRYLLQVPVMLHSWEASGFPGSR